MHNTSAGSSNAHSDRHHLVLYRSSYVCSLFTAQGRSYDQNPYRDLCDRRARSPSHSSAVKAQRQANNFNSNMLCMQHRMHKAGDASTHEGYTSKCRASSTATNVLCLHIIRGLSPQDYSTPLHSALSCPARDRSLPFRSSRYGTQCYCSTTEARDPGQWSLILLYFRVQVTSTSAVRMRKLSFPSRHLYRLPLLPAFSAA